MLSQGTEQWVWCVGQLISDSNNNFDSFLVNDVGIKNKIKIKARSRGIPVSILYQPVNEWRKSHLLDTDGVELFQWWCTGLHQMMLNTVVLPSGLLYPAVHVCVHFVWCPLEALLRLWQQHCSQLCQDQKWVPGAPPSKELTEIWPAA